MSSYKSLLRKLVLGTEREPFVDAEMLALRRSAGGDFFAERNEERLLELASHYAWLRRSSSVLPKAHDESLPAAADLRAEALPSPEAATLLRGCFAPGQEELQAEALRLLAEAGKVLPADLLPTVLDRAASTPDLQLYLPRVLGERGRWLAAQNPAWRVLAARGEDIDALPASEQALALRLLRYAEPSAVLPHLERAFRKEQAAERLKWLSLLGIQTQASDEPFLELCLDDRSKEVRRKAAAYLGRLPDSARSRRLTERLLLCCSPATPPSQWQAPHIDAALERDLPERPSDLPDPEAYWAALAAAVPLDLWLHGGRTPAQWLQLELPAPWLRGCWEAALHGEHPLWLQAFYEQAAAKSGKKKKNLPDYPALILEKKFSNANTYNVLVGYILRTIQPNAFSNHPLIDCMTRQNLPVADQNAREIVRRIQNIVETDTHFMDWSLQGLLHRLAYRVNPALLDEFRTGWNEQSRAWVSWRSTVRHFLATLKTRLQLLERLNSD